MYNNGVYFNPSVNFKALGSGEENHGGSREA